MIGDVAERLGDRFPRLEVSIKREGLIVLIEGTQASVTFHPRNKDKTYNALLDKCCELDRAYLSDDKELQHLKRTLDVQLTTIYQDYEKEQKAKKARVTNGQGDSADKPEYVPPTKLNISHEEWHDKLSEKYDSVRRITKGNFPGAWEALEFALSVKCILNIYGCNLPFMGIILGRPSSFKTLVIELFRGRANTFYTDSFTPKSFVSHNTSVTVEQLQEIDLLPKIKDKLFLTPELAPIFSAKEEDLTNLFGIITRILDGQGYESDTGAQGHRGYTGEFMFVWAGAAVEVPRKVHRIMGTLGPKMYFCRLPPTGLTDDEYEKMLTDDDFLAKRNELQSTIADYLDWFERGPGFEMVSNIPKMRMEKDDPAAIKYIVKLARLLAHLRGTVPTWETRDTQGADYAYSLATIEDPSRAATQLRNLARGHALSQGRTKMSISDLAGVIRVALSTAPAERTAVFNLLLAHEGKLSTTDITTGLNTSAPTAKRTMAELKAIQLVKMEHEESDNEWHITLDDEFSWFLEQEFRDLRDGKEIEGSQESSSQPKEKTPPQGDFDEKDDDSTKTVRGGANSFSNDDDTFLRIFSDLEQQSADGQVHFVGLKYRLISTGKFTAGEAYQATKDAVKAGAIEEIDFELYRRAGDK